MTPRKRPRITVAEAIRNVLDTTEAVGRTPDTLRNYRRVLTWFGALMAERGRVYLADVEIADLTAFWADLRRKGYADSTIAAAATPVGRVFNLAAKLPAESGGLAVNLWTKADKPKDTPELEPPFSEDELRRLLAVARKRKQYPLVLVLLDSGLRISEACSLKVRDVDLATGRVTLARGKGGPGRSAFLSQPTTAALREAIEKRGLQEDDRLFCSARTAWYFLMRLGEKAHVANCHAHRFRKTFAVAMLRGGCDLERLRRLMGHSDFTMLTRHYLPLVENDLADAHAKFSPVAALHLEDGG
jgi:integrase/recombinase XerD